MGLGAFFLYLYVGTMLSVSGPYDGEGTCQDIGYVGVAIANQQHAEAHFECARASEL